MVRIGKRIFSWNSVIHKFAGVKSEKLLSTDFGQKITDELVYAARRDGVPLGVTSGKWEPDVMKCKYLADAWYGSSLLLPGLADAVSLGKLVGISDTEFDVQFQLFEEVVGPQGPGVVTILFPVCRVISVNDAHSEGTKASEVDVGIRVIEPPLANGVRLASVIRQFSPF